jgi:RNA polymerase sigma-70 factor (ECF subfamily)
MNTAGRPDPVDYAALKDAELVELARKGRREAFRTIMQRCNQRLFRVARAVVRDDAEAEDIVEQAYGRAFTRLDSFRGDSSLSTWLVRITLNEARDRLRRRRPTVGLEAIEANPAKVADIIPFPGVAMVESPESVTARGQIRTLVEQAVDELPEDFRMVFILRVMEECSIEETAADLGVKPETVKTRLHRARALLRKALDEKLATSLQGTFPFLGQRCDRLQERVLAGLAERYGW